MSFGKTTPVLRIFDEAKAVDRDGWAGAVSTATVGQGIQVFPSTDSGHALGQPGHDHRRPVRQSAGVHQRDQSL